MQTLVDCHYSRHGEIGFVTTEAVPSQLFRVQSDIAMVKTGPLTVSPSKFTEPTKCGSLRIMQAKKRKVKATTRTGKIDLTRIRHVIRSLHVVPKSGGWLVTAIGAGQPTQQFSRKEDAIQFGELVAKRKRTSLIIHGRDGKINDIDAYRAHSLPPRDRNH